MTLTLSRAQRLHEAYRNWRDVHEGIHGPLATDEALIVYELIEYLMAVVQTEEDHE